MHAPVYVCYVYAHVYAQTVHICASREKMFILYMDVQTCMARKTPLLHVHRMGAFTRWMWGPGLSHPSLNDLEQATPSFAPVPPLYKERVGPDGPAHFDLLHFPVPGLQESSRTLVQGPGRMVYSVGTAVRRILPNTQGWTVALLASRPWTRRPRALSAHHPGTGLFSEGIFGRGS